MSGICKVVRILLIVMRATGTVVTVASIVHRTWNVRSLVSQALWIAIAVGFSVIVGLFGFGG